MVPQVKDTIVSSTIINNNSLKKALQLAVKNQTDITQTFTESIIFHHGVKVKLMKDVHFLIKDFHGLKILQLRYPMYEKKMRPMKGLHYVALHNTEKSLPEIMKDHLRRFPGIGFHYLITKEGVIIQTRSHKFEGDHTKNQNNGKVAVCFMLDLDKHKLNKNMISAYNNLLNFIKNHHIIKKEFGHGELTVLKVNWMLRDKKIPYQVNHKDLFNVKNVKMFETKLKKELSKLKRLKVPKKIANELAETTTCPGVHAYKLFDF
ncbi:MAG: N-acetylmuramoyl-L-alanine amidase [archaeon]